MERERASRNDSARLDNIFGGFGGFGSHRSMMSRFFGGRDLFDDPFFTHPWHSMFGSSGSTGSSPRFANPSGPVIEELNSEDEEEEDVLGTGVKKDVAQRNAAENKNPLVEHPDDQANEGKSKDVSYTTDHNTVERAHSKTQGVSFQRVAYGGIDGTYYTATTTRRVGGDGMVLEESKKADRTTGEATHRISRGIHEKGHSFLRKLNSDGKVCNMQTLHNLNEDELAGFEEAWKGNADRHLPSWNDGFDFHGNAGVSGGVQNRLATWAGSPLPSREGSERAGAAGPSNEARAYSYGGRQKKVVRINIE